MLLQVVADGLSAGSVYALVALALVVTYNTTGIANFAQGEMGTASAFVAYALLTSHDAGFLVAFGAALSFAFLLGVALDAAVLQRARDPTHLELVVTTLGFGLAIFGLVGWKWGAEQRPFPFPIPTASVVRLGDVAVSTSSLATVAIAFAMMLAFFALFRFTRLGTAMRAMQQDPLAARINGVPTRRVGALTFGISSVLGAVAALLTAPRVTLDPTLMWDALVKGFAAAVLGGMHSPVGAVLGGCLLGVVENLFGAYVSVAFKSVVALLTIVVVLWFRPTGILGRARPRRA